MVSYKRSKPMVLSADLAAKPSTTDLSREEIGAKTALVEIVTLVEVNTTEYILSVVSLPDGQVEILVSATRARKNRFPVQVSTSLEGKPNTGAPQGTTKIRIT